MPRQEAASAPELNLDAANQEALLRYGLLVNPIPKLEQFFNGAHWRFTVYTRHSGNPVMYYRADLDRYTYGWMLSRLQHLSPYYAKLWKRNGDQATFDLQRLLRDLSRLADAYEPKIQPEQMAEALDYYFNFNARSAPMRESRKVRRPWSECLAVANMPAADKSVIKELWHEPLPLDLLLLSLQGLNTSLLKDLADESDWGN